MDNQLLASSGPRPQGLLAPEAQVLGLGEQGHSPALLDREMPFPPDTAPLLVLPLLD